MSAGCGFHPEALFEFSEATRYYLRKTSLEVADAYVNCIEQAIKDIMAAPQRCVIVEAPEIRRFVCKRFPFVVLLPLGLPFEPSHRLRDHALQSRAGLLA